MVSFPIEISIRSTFGLRLRQPRLFFEIGVLSVASTLVLSSQTAWADGVATAVEGQVQLLQAPSANMIGNGPHAKYEGKFYRVAPLKIGELVPSLAVIHTGTSGKARIGYPNGDSIQIAPGSSIEIENGKSKSGKSAPVVLNAIFGRLRAVINKEEGEKRDVKVKTSVAVAGVRGTDFTVHFNPSQNEAKVLVLRGMVEVTPENGQAVEITSGKQSVVTAPPSDLKPDSAAMVAKMEEKKISQESLLEVQKYSDIKVLVDDLAKMEPTKIAMIQDIEQNCAEKTMASIQRTDPQLYSQLTAAAPAPKKGQMAIASALTPSLKKMPDLSQINAAAVGLLVPTAPIDNKKRLQEQLKESNDDIYQKYFKLNP